MKHILALAGALFLGTAAAMAYSIIDGRIDDSRYYPGTVHTYKVSIPSGYDPSAPSCLYVGLDGILCRAPERIDSLMATGDIPQMIGVYIQPGAVYAPDGKTVRRWNRSNEFDAPDGRFARFLETELLPAALATAGDSVKISPDPADAMIFGLSSGGIAAFNAAWQRPDMFGKVYSGCGTFVPMRGADGLQSLVRKTEPQNIRVFLQDGYSDTWNPIFGSWYEANRLLGSALEFGGYDCAFDWAEGGHSVLRTSAIFPEVMKWMWRHGASAAKPTGNGTLASMLADGGNWQAIDSRPFVSTLSSEAIYPGGAHAAVAVPGSNYLWQFLIDDSGMRYAGQPFYYLHSPENRTLRIGAMTFDGNGMLWVLTDAGIQIADQNGRVRGILRLPQEIRSALIDNRDAPLLQGSRILLDADGITLVTPAGSYRRRLAITPVSPGVTPASQGPA